MRYYFHFREEMMNEKARLLCLLVFIFAGMICFLGSPLLGASAPVKFTILYDNYVFKEGTKADWGFSCLIQGTEKTILFDTGTKENILLHNIEELDIDLKEVDMIVISHDHGDHTGGLFAVLEINPHIAVYMPESFAEKYRDLVDDNRTRIIAVSDPVEICRDVHLTGEMGRLIKEQSLVLDTSQGLIILSGCSHQGVVNILDRAAEISGKQMELMFGGFHLMRHTEAQVAEIIAHFRAMGVEKCGATHCTGDRQIEWFKKAFGRDYVPMGTGRVLVIRE
jgi:7,8-dihydropterin-6-yl-methyl-4-(beta-D-ribofuranosyl)aminobenzene 5'-phosphate synthase